MAFKDTMKKFGILVPRSEICLSVEEAQKVAEKLNYPVVVRPAYTHWAAQADGLPTMMKT